MSPSSKLDALKSDIIAILSSCGENKSLKRKKITSKSVKESKLKDLDKGEVKKALKELVKSGRVKELGEDGGSSRYMIFPDEKESESSGGSGDSGSSSENDSGSSSESDSQDKDEPLPFAEVMRKRAGESSKTDEKETYGGDDDGSEDEREDIDDEIRRLEAELAAGSDDDDDSSEYSEGSDDESIPDDDELGGKSKRKISFGPSTEYTDDRMNNSDDHVPSEGGIIRSNLEAERIAPLPKSALPQMKRRKLKGIDADVDGDGEKEKEKKNKRKTSNNDDEDINEGLREAVKEVLSGYEARSHERIPFYCRVCSVQSKDMESFLAHKKTDFHKAAVKAERKATYCQACRKQFTSPVQMEEHLNSKRHHERMIYLRSKNQGGRGGGGRGGRGAGRFGAGRGRFGRDGRGYGGRGRGNSRARSNRQWC